MESSPSIGLDVADAQVRHAVERTLKAAGWAVVGTGGSLCVTDSALTTAPAAVAVVRSEPAACAAAVNRTIAGKLLGAACVDELDHLPRLVDAVLRDLTALTPRVLSLAAAAPPLTARQLDVLRELLMQKSNREIADVVHLSEATVKRELNEIGKSLGASTRIGIATAAYALGFRASDGSG